MSDTMPKGLHALGYHTVRRKKSGKHEARWADEKGHIRARSFPDKAVAQKYAETKANEIMRAAVGLGQVRKPIAEALEDFLARRLKPETIELNRYRMQEFLAGVPALGFVDEITDTIINNFDRALEAKGCNPGGRKHHLTVVRAFCNHAVEKAWLPVSPFKGFKMPRSEFEGRALTEEEFEKLCSIGWLGGNEVAVEHGIAWQGANQHGESDLWIRRALILGRETMLRISQVFKLTPADFKEPDQLHVAGIKGQKTVWIALTPAAVEVVKELVAITPPDIRLFSYWKTLEAMRQAVQRKAERVGLKGVRFHDACKVSRVSQLDAAGFSIKEIAQVSNTTTRTLLDHYIKPDRQKTFDKYREFMSRPTPDQPGTKNMGNSGLNVLQSGIDPESGKEQKRSNSQ